MKKIILGLVSVAMLSAACGDSDEGSGGRSKTIKMQKLELDDAKYLSLTGTPSRAQSDESEVGLFKIDENGNISTVVLSCVEAEDGTVTKVRNDIQVLPRHLFSLSGAYTLMLQCEFKTAEGNYFDMRPYYEPDAFYFHILVRNSDGKIFYIPQSAGKYFEIPEPPATALGNNGDLYILPHEGRDLLAVTMQNEDLVLKQVNPNAVGIEGNEIWPLDNGTIVVPSMGNSYTFLYPNGGFEQMPLFDKGEIFLTKTDDGIKAVQVEERAGSPQREYIVSLHDYHVGRWAGSNTLSAPIASISSGTDYSTNLGDPDYIDWVSKVSANWTIWLYPVYETADSYFLGQCLVVDKQTSQITPLNWDQSNHVIFPTKENTYKGLAWRVFSEGAEWFNIETLEYGVVNFDLALAGCKLNVLSENIPSGEATLTGVRNSDGKQIVCFVNIETGAAVFSEQDSNRPVTVLIPLN